MTWKPPNIKQSPSLVPPSQEKKNPPSKFASLISWIGNFQISQKIPTPLEKKKRDRSTSFFSSYSSPHPCPPPFPHLFRPLNLRIHTGINPRQPTPCHLLHTHTFTPPPHHPRAGNAYAWSFVDSDYRSDWISGRKRNSASRLRGGVKAWDSFSFEGTEMGVGGTVAGKVFGSFEAFGARLAREWFWRRFGSEDDGADW